MIRLFPLALAIVLMAASARAAIVIPHMGRIMKIEAGADVPVDGKVDLKFGLYTRSIDGTGENNLVWEDTFKEVQVAKGVYAVELGNGTTQLTEAEFDGRPNLFLQISVVEGETARALLPRMALASAPLSAYASNAAKLGGKEPSAYVSADDFAAFKNQLTGGGTGISIPWAKLTDVPAPFADGTDNEGLSRIYTGTALLGSGTEADPVAVGPLGITSALLANDAVSTAKLANGAVTAEKLAVDAVTPAIFQAGSISIDKLNKPSTNCADGSVLKVSGSGWACGTDAGSAGSLSFNVAPPLAQEPGTTPTLTISDNGIGAGKLAPNAIETAKIKDAAVTAAKIADGAVTPAKLSDVATMLAAAGMLPNLLTNGGFETDISNAGKRTPAALWWRGGTALTSATAETGAGNFSQGARALRAAGPVGAFVFQSVENFADYRGKTVTFSVDVKVGSDGAKIDVDDGVAAEAKTVSVAAGFQRITITKAVAANANKLAVRLYPFASGTVFDGAMLVVGSVPGGVAFLSSPVQEDAFRTMRWYETGASWVHAHDVLENGPTGTGLFTFSVAKVRVPTLTMGSTAYKCTDYAGTGAEIDGTASSPTASALGMSASADCTALRCTFSTELAGATNAKQCFLTISWTAEVNDTTY